MNKIPTVFIRDFNARPSYVTKEVNPECQWVLDGVGISYRKLDGICVMLDSSGEWWARREVKEGKAQPPRFFSINFDSLTGKCVGWEPMAQSAFAKYHAEAMAHAKATDLWAGTYELIGPKVNGNPECRERHELVSHEHTGAVWLPDRSYGAIRQAVLGMRRESGAEGIVFHYGDGVRFAKIKARDFRPEATGA